MPHIKQEFVCLWAFGVCSSVVGGSADFYIVCWRSLFESALRSLHVWLLSVTFSSMAFASLELFGCILCPTSPVIINRSKLCDHAFNVTLTAFPSKLICFVVCRAPRQHWRTEFSHWSIRSVSYDGSCSCLRRIFYVDFVLFGILSDCCRACACGARSSFNFSYL